VSDPEPPPLSPTELSSTVGDVATGTSVLVRVVLVCRRGEAGGVLTPIDDTSGAPELEPPEERRGFAGGMNVYGRRSRGGTAGHDAVSSRSGWGGAALSTTVKRLRSMDIVTGTTASTWTMCTES
jgi:hypothetical protein